MLIKNNITIDKQLIKNGYNYILTVDIKDKKNVNLRVLINGEIVFDKKINSNTEIIIAHQLQLMQMSKPQIVINGISGYLKSKDGTSDFYNKPINISIEIDENIVEHKYGIILNKI